VRKRSGSRAWAEGSASKNQIAEHVVNLATVASRTDNAVVVVSVSGVVGNTLVWLAMLNTGLLSLTSMIGIGSAMRQEAGDDFACGRVPLIYLAGIYERRCLEN
jgi:hypothetical protein